VWAIYPFHYISGISSFKASPKRVFVWKFFHVMPLDIKKRQMFVQNGRGQCAIAKGAVAGHVRLVHYNIPGCFQLWFGRRDDYSRLTTSIP
jgi:hypothetical protein